MLAFRRSANRRLKIVFTSLFLATSFIDNTGGAARMTDDTCKTRDR